MNTATSAKNSGEARDCPVPSVPSPEPPLVSTGPGGVGDDGVKLPVIATMVMVPTDSTSTLSAVESSAIVMLCSKAAARAAVVESVEMNAAVEVDAEVIVSSIACSAMPRSVARSER